MWCQNKLLISKSANVVHVVLGFLHLLVMFFFFFLFRQQHLEKGEKS